MRAWDLLSRFPHRGMGTEGRGRHWWGAQLLLQQATTLLILWFAVSSSGVLQVQQKAWSCPSGALGKQQALSQGWHKFWDYSLPGQVSAGWSLQPGLKGFKPFTKQDPSGKVMTTQITPNGQVYCTAVGHIPSSLETRQYHIIYTKQGREHKAWTKELLPGTCCLRLPSESQHQHGICINAETIITASYKRDGLFLESS